MKIGVIDYGAGNMGNVFNALRYLGINAGQWQKGDTYDGLLLPGVGAFDPAVMALRQHGIDRAISKHVAEGRPFLGICLGMQLLCSGSEEGTQKGLEYIDAMVKKIPTVGVKVPNIGWSRIDDVKLNFIKDGTSFYFVHSFYLPVISQTVAVIDYGVKMSAAVKRDNIYGVQFHPERSGEAGLEFLKSFSELCR
jgi:glutamine amidotransferase